jgi:hypothetical protein
VLPNAGAGAATLGRPTWREGTMILIIRLGVSALRKGVRAGGYRTAIATIAVFLEKAHSVVHESEGGS